MLLPDHKGILAQIVKACFDSLFKNGSEDRCAGVLLEKNVGFVIGGFASCVKGWTLTDGVMGFIAVNATMAKHGVATSCPELRQKEFARESGNKGFLMGVPCF
jgi:hypothetical protein